MGQEQPISLSICIPTFNRYAMLSEALHSIVSNISNSKNIELIVSDNASTDKTKEVVESFQETISVLHYHRNDNNIGPVGNVRKVIDLAKGYFVWIFSDDDIMAKNALTYLLNFLSNNEDVNYVFYSRELKTFDLNPVKEGVQPTGLSEDIIFENGNDLFCGCNGQMPFILGFFSSTIIKRSLWLKNAAKIQVISDNFAWDHLLIILRAIKDCKCAILARVGVFARLNYRPLKSNSRIGFDDSIYMLNDAMNLGYSQKHCLAAIKEIIRIESKSFVVDKARGERNDTILSFLSKYGLSGMALAFFPWSVISMLPSWLLNKLWALYSLIKESKT